MATRKQKPPTPQQSRSPEYLYQGATDANPQYHQDPVLQVVNGYAQPGGTPNLRTGNDSWSRPREVSVDQYAAGNKQQGLSDQ